MKPIKEMTIAELAAFVGSHLKKKGIEVVLSGGACVSIYTDNKYVSMDLDLINTRFARRGVIIKAMEEIGFKEENRYFKHPHSNFYIEFPNGPLSVGKEPVKRVDEHRLSTGLLRIISPSDCVKDRLAGYYYWGDLQCLEQALMVAGTNQVDLQEIERWSKVEGKSREFNLFRNRTGVIESN